MKQSHWLAIAFKGSANCGKRSATEIRNWEKRNSDIALFETHQELESQRLQVQQANQWADQAQRDQISLCVELEMRSRLY